MRRVVLVGLLATLGAWLTLLVVTFGSHNIEAARLSVVFSTLTVPGVNLFVRSMTGPVPRVSKGAAVVLIGFAALLGVATLTTRLVWDEISFVDGVYRETYGPGIVVYTAFMLLGFLDAFVRLVRSARSGVGMARLRVQWVLLGFLGMVSIAITTNLFLPLAGVQDFMVLGPSAALVLIACLSIAVVRYQLLGIETILHRTATWLVVSAIGILPVAVAATVLRPWLEQQSTAGYTLVAMAAMYVFLAYHRSVQPRVDHWFGRRRYQLEGTVRAFVEDLSHVASRAEIGGRVLRLCGLFYPKFSAVYLMDDARATLILSVANGADGLSQSLLLDADAQALLLGGPVEVRDPRLGLRDLGEVSGELIVPLVAVGELVGAVVLGGKQSLVPYDGFDRDLLRGAASAAGVAFNNAVTYERAITDSLTGLYNRSFFEQRLRQELARGDRAQRFGLVLIDLDKFKNVNDTFGHQAGDAVLEEVARRLRRVVRASDLVARLGGDEFVVLFRNLEGPQDLDVLVERTRSSLCSGPMTYRGAAVSVGGSVGASLFPEDGTTAEALVHTADAALYAQKRGTPLPLTPIR